jgi:hypothetical protein
MKISLNLFLILLLLFFSCKTKQNINNSNPIKEAATPAPVGKSFGTVSFQYKATGCSTVIVIKDEAQNNTITLIPKDKLPDEFDKDGLEIYFNYRPLKMPNPKGCSIGIPASITDISKK